jgi:prostatic aicd phosphatase
MLMIPLSLSSSPSFIVGINDTLVNDEQLLVRADAGGEKGVIMNSAASLLQGLYPANSSYKTTLANGSTVTGLLGGYQYIPIESVQPGNDISLEGWTNCAPFTANTNEFYNSTEFKQKAEDYAGFLQSLPPFLDGRPANLENMWNVRESYYVAFSSFVLMKTALIFDFMNVQYIHNPDFAKALPPTHLAQARHLANFMNIAFLALHCLRVLETVPSNSYIRGFLTSLSSPSLI